MKEGSHVTTTDIGWLHIMAVAIFRYKKLPPIEKDGVYVVERMNIVYNGQGGHMALQGVQAVFDPQDFRVVDPLDMVDDLINKLEEEKVMEETVCDYV